MRQPIALGLNEGRSPPIAATHAINMYFEPAALNSRAPKFPAGPFSTVGGPLYGTPGIDLFTTAGMADTRAARYALGYLYVLSGGQLYRVSQGGLTTLCTGDAIPSIGPAMMTDNGIQLTVLSGGLSFVVVGTTIAKITSAAYPAAGVGSVDTIDGYTIFTTAGGGAPTFGPAVNISAITQANPAVVTAVAHGLTDNSQAFIASVVGMTQLNNRSFTVLVVDADNVQLVGIDSTSYGAYVSGGTIAPVTSQPPGQWFISALYDSSSIDALQFATAESNPDALLRVLVANREVWLFGSVSIEPWQDVGTSPFAFAQITGSIMNRGTAAAGSPAQLTGTVFWLGDDKIVYSAVGYNPQRISNYAVEDILENASTLSDAYGMTYSQGGHSFYVLTLPAANYTLVYDIGAQIWHERRTGTQLTPSIWNVSCIVACWQGLYVGSTVGRVGILDLNTYTEFGQPIRSAAISPPFYADGFRATMSLVELETQLGVGLPSGQGSLPTVMVRTTDDGYASYGNQKECSLGVTGDYVDRAMVRRLGLFRQRALEFSCSDPCFKVFYGIRVTLVKANA